MRRQERRLICHEKLTCLAFNKARKVFICPHCLNDVKICYIALGPEKLTINKCYCDFCGQRFQISKKELQYVDNVENLIDLEFYPIIHPTPKIGRKRSMDEDWDSTDY